MLSSTCDGLCWFMLMLAIVRREEKERKKQKARAWLGLIESSLLFRLLFRTTLSKQTRLWSLQHSTLRRWLLKNLVMWWFFVAMASSSLEMTISTDIGFCVHLCHTLLHDTLLLCDILSLSCNCLTQTCNSLKSNTLHRMNSLKGRIALLDPTCHFHRVTQIWSPMD